MPRDGGGVSPTRRTASCKRRRDCASDYGETPSRQPSCGLIARCARRSIKANWVWNRWERKRGARMAMREWPEYTLQGTMLITKAPRSRSV